jgi:hypothetical protein
MVSQFACNVCRSYFELIELIVGLRKCALHLFFLVCFSFRDGACFQNGLTYGLIFALPNTDIRWLELISQLKTICLIPTLANKV